MEETIRDKICSQMPSAYNITVERADGLMDGLEERGEKYRASFWINGTEYRALFDASGDVLHIP